jgi:YD repeat-containing protein
LLRELDLKNYLRSAFAACALLLAGAAAHAAPTDCINPSDPTAKAICQPPELTPVSYGACIMANASNIDSATGFCNQQWGLLDGPAYSEAPVIGAMNCTYQRVTRNTNSPVTAFAWKAEGQGNDGANVCWTGTVKWKYGVEMLGFAEQSPPGWYNVHGLRTRKAQCRPGETAVYVGSDIEYCTLPVANCADCEAGNPTKPSLGIKVERSTDYAGAGAHALSFERTYRSTWSPQVPQNRIGGFWAHNYSASAKVLEASTSGTRYAFVTRADGQHHVFTNTGSAWLAATGSRDALSELRDAGGTLIGLQLLIWQDDSTETYDLTGRLQKIIARNGWTTTLTYSDTTTPTAIAPRAGLLISVKNQFGRELKFTYDAQGRMVELLPPGAVSGNGAGSASSPIRYAYDEAASLGPGVAAQGQLSSVIWQDGSVRRYHHEQADVWYIANGPQLLTGITDEAGVRYATWAYGPGTTYDINLIGARVVRSEHAGGTDKVEFAYSNNTGSSPRTTTITDYSSGSAQQAIHTYTQQGNSYKPSAVSAPCPQCGNTAQATSYNAAGDKAKEIAHDGSVTFLAYDARGRETERAVFPSSYQSATTRPALGAATKVISTQWHATFNLPTQVAEPNKTTANTYSSKGLLTGTSWTATTDATGAAKFTAVKTGSTYATGWSYSASGLATTIVTKETDAGTTVAVETSRWTLAYSALGDLTKITNAAVTPNPVATVTSYSPTGQPLTGKTSDGKTFTYTYRADRQVATLSLSDGYLTTYTYNTKGQLTEARASDGGLVTIDYNSAAKPTRYVANGEVVFDNSTTPALRAGSALPSALFAGVSAQAAGTVTQPRPIPLPEIDWGGFGTRVGDLAKGCSRTVGVGLSLLLFSSEVGTCSTVDSRQKQECKKDPCEKELPTSDAARREALRRVGLPVGSSVPVASNLASPGYEQYVYWKASEGKFVVLSHHPADGDHPCPHWHASNAYMTRAGSTQISDIELRRNGAFRYENQGSLVVAHRNEQ